MEVPLLQMAHQIVPCALIYMTYRISVQITSCFRLQWTHRSLLASKQNSFARKELQKQDRTFHFLKNHREDVVGYLHLAVAQSNYKRDMLARHGSKGISFDARHGVSKHKNVKLISLAFLDDCKRGVAVAHCLADH